MDVLLINPPTYNSLGYLKGFRIQEIPLALAYIAAVLEQDRHDVVIMDMNTLQSKEEFLSTLRGKEFDVVGFTATTPVIGNVFRTARIVKKVHPDAKIVLGGWHATALPRDTLENCPEIDFIVKGEGEYTMRELVRAIQDGTRDFSGILGLVYRDKDTIVETGDRPLIENLDELPLPARHLLDHEAYSKMGVPYVVYDIGRLSYDKKKGYPLQTHMWTSRGCYNRCTFCADHIIYHQKYRAHSAERVVKEIKNAVRRFNIRIFNFMDPVFLVDPRRVEKICRSIIESRLSIQWCCQGRVNNKLTVEQLKLMKEAGCQKIYYGIESGSPKMLKRMNKKITIAQIKDCIEKTKMAGIPVHVFFLYGFPDETMEDYYQTRQLIREIKPDNIEVHKVIPLPGTDLFDEGFRFHKIDVTDWKKFHYYHEKELYLEDPRKISERRKIQKKFFNLSKNFNLSFHYIFGFIKRIKTFNYLLSILKGFKVFIEYHTFTKRYSSF